MKPIRINTYDVVGDEWKDLGDLYPQIVFEIIFMPLRDVFWGEIAFNIERNIDDSKKFR